MSRASDFSSEMSGEPPRDDALASFAEEVRFAVSGPPPEPSMALAAILEAGFSGFSPTEKGDLLVTAASNVHGPAPQVAGLPNWKEENEMPTGGFCAGLLSKLGCLGGAAKAAIASATAVVSMGLAGGAAGVLPAPAQNLVATAVNEVTPLHFPDAGGATNTVENAIPALPAVSVPQLPGVTVPSVPGLPAVSASASTGAGARAGNTSVSSSTNTNTHASAASPTVPSLPPVSVPPAVTNLVKLPACVSNLAPVGGAAPDPTKLASQIPGCISQVLGTAGLPPQVATCVSSILGTIGGANGLSPASVPSVGSLSVSSCVPMDSSKCVSNLLGLLGTLPGATNGGGLPGLGSLPGLSTLPGLSSVTGCVPMNVSACLSSLTSAVSAGNVTSGSLPKLDLSACMPTTALPGIGSLPGVGSLPGLSGALPFFGK